jgi:hypothetical protein
VTTTGKKDTRLSDDELVRVSALIKESDSVELKLTVPAMEHGSAVTALELDPLDAQIRQIFFFDTPELTLYQNGVVARARRVQGKGDDSVVKLRPIVPAELPSDVRASPDFGVEVDAMPGGYVCSGSLKGTPKKDVRATLAGDATLGSLFSKGQRRLYASHAPEGVALDDLSVLGPIFVLKLKFAPAEFKRKMVAEMWLYPDGSRLLELSTKCTPGEAFQVAGEARAFFAGRGVDLTGEQETKTRKALEFFAKQLKTSAASTRRPGSDGGS